MDLRRLRPADWLTGLAGLVLLVSLWTPWYRLGGASGSGWETLSVLDLWLALVGVLALALVVVTVTRDAPAVPVAVDVVTVTVAGLGVLLVLIRLLFVPDGALGDVTISFAGPAPTVERAWGQFLGAGATLVTFGGAFLALRNPAAPALRPAPEARTMPAPPATAAEPRS